MRRLSVRRYLDPRERWWGRLYASRNWYPSFEDEWRRHFRANHCLGDLKAQVHA